MCFFIKPYLVSLSKARINNKNATTEIFNMNQEVSWIKTTAL